MNSLNNLSNISEQFSTTEKMPVLFIGHGNPINAIEENQFVEGLKNSIKDVPNPNAILCISAHWFTNGTKVTAMEFPKTIHDFGGFPQALFEVQYPVKGSPELAKTTSEILLPTEVKLDYDWGLDHGTWSVLKHLYPNANVPVIQLSIDYTQPPSYHFELAQKLQTLRQKGVLIIGSGNIIHNLRLVDFQNFDKDNYGYDWAMEAREIINNLITKGDFKSLIEYKNLSKAVQLAIPTPEHYLPLIYAIGLQQKNEESTFFNDKLVAGSLSMTSIKIQ
jgi:4,5-DOPA dioxygenase extradiol